MKVNLYKIVRGQSLFEVVFAIAVLALVGIAIVSLATTSVSNNVFANNKTRANKYALETIEWLRNRRDNNWIQVYNRTNSSGWAQFCVPDLMDDNWWSQDVTSSDPPPYCDITDPDAKIDNTMFYRELWLDRADLVPGGPEESVMAKVRVYWIDNEGIDEGDYKLRIIELDTHLSDWKNAI